MNVLICSQYGEIQVDEVCQRLSAMGINAVIFERYRKDQFISYHYSNEKLFAIFKSGNEEYQLTSETFPVVWYRPKPIILSEIPGETAKLKEKFCVNEWRVILQSLDVFLAKSKWINPIEKNQKAANKTYQLKLANELGLNIPETVVTNDALKTLSLFDNSRVIYKTLSSFFSANQAIYTNEVNYDQVMQKREEIAMAPGIFQKYIEKKFELRVTLIGEHFFITRINSQIFNDSKIDWRRLPNDELYEVGELSDSTKNKLLALHKQLGLVYAAYDFIVDTEGIEIFIECNPTGQWLWIKNSHNLEISQVMANELIN